MYFRPGNLVRHKSGGPIMMIDDIASINVYMGSHDGPSHQCTWVEQGIKRFGSFRASQLQCVYADGTPRNYDEEGRR
ncbi:hypothetical protein JQ604_37795 [Bradyrhizobium jicamae]|uniref:hypothetical protein n=1 Tax=Bradyrhizobium jicamae TaxID=280332 RepID=UPI001BA4CD77|nr:hypothetical protein [Bradyrhizobium jicamae]MBR0757966.1 hypothetical protein [Bradyrhizobium jicamae]